MPLTRSPITSGNTPSFLHYNTFEAHACSLSPSAPPLPPPLRVYCAPLGVNDDVSSNRSSQFWYSRTLYSSSCTYGGSLSESNTYRDSYPSIR